jgi:trimeric autotransporter adhesin
MELFWNARRRAVTRMNWRIVALGFAIAAATVICRGQVTTTAVQDTVYRADGSYATGTILVSWPAFESASGKTVAAGNLNVAIGANGQVTLNLAPNVGATPAGSYYTAVYHLDDGTVKTEYWEVPNVASTTVAAIRTLVMPASVAVQTLTSSQVDSMLNQYLPLQGGNMSGTLQLFQDPQQPMQAATKNYVDNAVAPLSATIAGTVTAAPKASQIIVQPPGTALSANNFAGRYYASQFQTGSGNNGIANLTSGSNCTLNSPGGPSGCTVVVEPSYASTEGPQGTNEVAIGPSANLPWAMNTHVHDERNGITADYYENPFSAHPLQASGNSITADYALDFQQWPLYSASNPSAEKLDANDYQGGYNFYNYYAGGQPQYFFKTYYSNLDLNTTDYSSGQEEAIQNNVHCYGTGDCIGMTQLVSCDGGMNASDDEGCHGGDWTVTEDPLVYKGTVTAAAAVGATIIHTNGTAGQGTEGQDRLLVDTNPVDIITGNSITGYAGALPTGSTGSSAVNPDSAQDGSANFPVSTMIQLCYAGSDNGANGAAGCTAGQQPIGYIPSAKGMINPATSVVTNVVASYTAAAPDTGLPAGFCTPSTLQSTTPGAACYLPASGVACLTDQEEYETVNYTYNSSAQQITLLNLRFPHLNGVFFAQGGLCGYAVEQQSDVFSGDANYSGISQVFPVEGSPNPTTFYYTSQRVNNGYSLPILGVSNDIAGNSTTGGGECFSLNISAVQLQSDGKTVVIASTVPFGEGNLSASNGMTLAINTPNASYNGNYVVSWGAVNSNANELSYVLPASPTGAAPTSGTASFCNTNYKLYPAVRVNSVLDAATNTVDGTMNTMPSPVAFAGGDTVMEPHYPWIYTGHDSGRGVNQFTPRFYQGGALYGMTYGYLLSGTPFVGFSINNGTDQNRYLGYGGTHEAPGFGYDLNGEWDDSFVAGFAPENAVLYVEGCKPNPIGCNKPNSNFNVLLMPNGGQALNYDPNSLTWTFGSSYFPQNNPQISPAGTVQAYNLHALNTVTAKQVGVGAGYLFNLGGAIGITTTPSSPGFSTWYASYAYGFGAQNTSIIDGYMYRGATANSVDCGTGTGDTSCTFTLGVLNAGAAVNAPNINASASVATPAMTLGGGSTVTHIAYYTTGAITPAAVPAQSCSDQTFAVTGLQATDNIGSVQPPNSLGNLSVNAYASAANTLMLHFCNVSTASALPPSGTYSFLAMR